MKDRMKDEIFSASRACGKEKYSPWRDFPRVSVARRLERLNDWYLGGHGFELRGEQKLEEKKSFRRL